MNAPLSREQWEEMRRQSEASVLDTLEPNRALLPYQSRGLGLLMDAGTNVLVIEKSRRIGFTWGLASYAALKAALAKSAGGMDVMYISYSQEMTREFVDACAMWAKSYALAAAEVDEFIFDDRTTEGEKASIQAFRIRFDSGFEIVALSSAPRSLRGKQGVVIIDEAAFVDSLSELLKAALAFLIWGGQVIVCSTHDGTENPFNGLVQDTLAARNNYQHMRVDFDQALREGLFKRICLVRGIEWTPEGEAEWRDTIIGSYGDGADEELFCIPAQGSGTWLSAPLIEARMTEPPEIILRLDLPADFLQRDPLARASLLAPFMEELELFLEGLPPDVLMALGFDFARVTDLSELTLLSIEAALKRRSRLVIEMRRVPYQEQKQITEKVIRAVLSRIVGAAFDATGAGAEVAEAMGRLFGFAEKDGTGGGLVHEIKLSQDWYRENMPPVKAALEDDALSLARDEGILSDFRLVKVVRGIPTIPDLRTGEKNKKRHGDAVVSTALAYFASRMQWFESAYRPVPPPDQQGDLSKLFDRPRGDDRAPDPDVMRQPLGARLRGGGIY